MLCYSAERLHSMGFSGCVDKSYGTIFVDKLTEIVYVLPILPGSNVSYSEVIFIIPVNSVIHAHLIFAAPIIT